MKTEFIYLITCNANGKQYVGKAKNVQNRWNDHKSGLRKGKHPNKHLQSAWAKYGEQAFTFTIIDEAPAELIYQREIELIAQYNSYKNGFNQTIGGEGANGVKWEDERRKNFSLSKTLLDKFEVVEIYNDTYLTLKELASMYNVSTDTIYDIQSKRKFTNITKHLPDICRDYLLLDDFSGEVERAGIYNRYGGNYIKVNGKRTLLAY